MMLNQTATLGQLATYGLLFLAVPALWLRWRYQPPVWLLFFGGAVAAGLGSGEVALGALAPMLLLAALLYYKQQTVGAGYRKLLAVILIVLLGYGLGAHRFSAFHNLPVILNERISLQGVPFSLYLNFDKTLVGLFILGAQRHLLATGREWQALCLALSKAKWRWSVRITALFGIAWLSGSLAFDPKWPECTFIWLVTNLLFVCMAEEAFFRGFLQKELQQYWGNDERGGRRAAASSALLFGLAHYGGGWLYVVWASLAGFFYSQIYFETQRIEASIILHFIVNCLHFFLFIYPMAA